MMTDLITLLAGCPALEGTPALVAISDIAVVTPPPPALPRLRERKGADVWLSESLPSCLRVSLVCWVKAVGGQI